MSGFKKISPEEMSGNVFHMMAEQWMLITAGDSQKLNTMTAGWGALGVLWGKPVAICYVRPQRYTFQFMERERFYSLSFYGEEYRKQLQICGTKSGRDIDKVRATGFTTAFADCGAPYFEEADLVIICKKLYSEDIVPDRFVDSTLEEKWYPDRDFHKSYVGEIIDIFRK